MKVTNRQTVYDGHYKMLKLTLQDGEKSFDRELFERGHAVAALVLDTRQNKFMFVRQWRPGSETELVELVAGVLEGKDASPEATIRREIEEEMGYAVDKLEPIRTFYSSPGGTSEQVHLFYAEVSRKTGEGGGVADENESIELVVVEPGRLAEMELSDAKSLVGIYWWLSRQS